MYDATGITLNVTEILALLALVWGLGRMSQKLDGAIASVTDLVSEVRTLATGLAEVAGRVGILEALNGQEDPRPRRQR